MDYQKFCDDVYLNDPPLSNVPVVYLPCPHKCYKSKVINRLTLTHDQHVSLLATPKGFVWDKNTGLAMPPKCPDEDEPPKNLTCALDQRYVGDITSDIWNFMTPKYRRKFEKSLIKQFDMSPRQAKEFLKEQKLRAAFKQRKPHSKIVLNERHAWVKETADLVSDKLTACMEGMMTARRTMKVQAMADAILAGFGDLTGERCDPNKPKNRIQKMQVFASNGLAVWLSRILGDYEQELCRKKLEHVDTDSSDDEETPSKNKPAKPKPKPEDPKAEEPKPEEPKSEEPKPEEPKQEEPKPEELKPEEPKPEETKPKTA